MLLWGELHKLGEQENGKCNEKMGTFVLLSFLDLAANNAQGCMVASLRQLPQVSFTVLDMKLLFHKI